MCDQYRKPYFPIHGDRQNETRLQNQHDHLLPNHDVTDLETAVLPQPCDGQHGAVPNAEDQAAEDGENRAPAPAEANDHTRGGEHAGCLRAYSQRATRFVRLLVDTLQFKFVELRHSEHQPDQRE